MRQDLAIKQGRFRMFEAMRATDDMELVVNFSSKCAAIQDV